MREGGCADVHLPENIRNHSSVTFHIGPRDHPACHFAIGPADESSFLIPASDRPLEINRGKMSRLGNLHFDFPETRGNNNRTECDSNNNIRSARN
jgi:hypothetical protein